MLTLSVAEVRSLAESAMSAVGYDPVDAEVIADHLLDCELRGLGFGGLARALSIADRLRWVPGTPRAIAVDRESPVSAAIDGGDQVGYLVALRATELAIEKARATGIAVVGARETWYTGMFSYYLERLAAAGLVGMVAGSGGQIVAPHGGTEGRFATNPIAFGFPSPAGPVIWDIGTSSTMLAEVLLAQRLGEQLPEGRAFAADGTRTTDPGAALGGALAVWGGHKGSGLAVVVQLLGMLAGASHAPDGLRDCGFLLVAVDPGLLGSAEDFARRVAEYAEQIRATRPADPTRPVRMPFDRSAAERARRLEADAIEIGEEVHAAIVELIGSTPPPQGAQAAPSEPTSRARASSSAA